MFNKIRQMKVFLCDFKVLLQSKCELHPSGILSSEYW
jgi:hypothetical protein